MFFLDEALAERKAEQFDCVISALPMLTFPMERRIALLDDLLARIPAGAPVIQITYVPLSPVIRCRTASCATTISSFAIFRLHSFGLPAEQSDAGPGTSYRRDSDKLLAPGPLPSIVPSGTG